MSIEICIVAYGSEEYLDAWFVQASKIHASLAIADNHPAGSTIAAVSRSQIVLEKGQAVRTLALAHNPGFGAACNALARTSSAEWLVFLNPDATIDTFPKNKFEPGIVYGARQRRPNGLEIHCSGQNYRVRDELIRSWFRRMPPSANGRGYVSGGAMAISRLDFVALGGFDERMFLFYEDIDLCIRAIESGRQVLLHPEWKVVHEIGHAVRRDWKAALTASYESGRYFHTKHHHNVRAYDAYVSVDSIFRAAVSLLTRHSLKRTAYLHLTTRSLTNLFRPTNETASDHG